jgi:alcohol dehydrogenase
VQQLIQGLHSINQLPAFLVDAGYPDVFLVSGQHFMDRANTLFPADIHVSHFIKQGSNVTVEEADLALEKFIANEQQAIVAIGGGSVMDIGKSIVYRCITAGKKPPLLVAVPTTAGSGSEATHFAVVYKQGKKQSWVHPDMLPAVVVLDEELTFSLPAFQTAVSGFDVLCQAVESYWNKNATVTSKQYATECIQLWQEHILDVIHQPTPFSRKQMLKAAHLAGQAINITRTTGPHALSYYLTSNFGVPHGQAVAFFLPVFFLYNGAHPVLCSLLGVANETAASEYVSAMMKKAGLATKLVQIGIDKEQIVEALLNEVNEERFANNPVSFDKEKLKALIIQYL